MSVIVDDFVTRHRDERDERAADATRYPTLHVLSPGMFYRGLPFPVPSQPDPLEVVFLSPARGKAATESHVNIVEWNVLWESAQLRRELFKDWNEEHRNVPAWLLKYGDRNIHFVPHVKTDPSQTFEPLYKLLPLRILEKAGLPPAGRGMWPIFMAHDTYGDMPGDAYARFERALSMHLWPRLLRGVTHHAFSDNDPIQILSHAPAFWMPHALHVCFERAACYENNDRDWTDEQRREVSEVNAHPTNLEVGVAYQASRFGGPLWEGEADASEAADEMIEHADRSGRLRALIDTVLSNRTDDDFSACWSREKEDFERAMFHKRAKVKVSFVELPEQEAIHSAFTQLAPSAEREAVEQLMFNDFLTLLDEKSRSIVICMRRGITTAVDISRELGYANHTPVTKRLHKIRRAAQRYFFEDRSV